MERAFAGKVLNLNNDIIAKDVLFVNNKAESNNSFFVKNYQQVVEDNKRLKSRAWGFLVYPDSCVHNWFDIFERSGAKMAISPLHDRDIHKETGEFKKPHYHILVAYLRAVSFKTIAELSLSVWGTKPIIMHNLRGAYEYLWHKNSPDKPLYEFERLRLVGGFDIDVLDRVERGGSIDDEEFKRLMLETRRIIKEKGFAHYYAFVSYLEEKGLEDLVFFTMKGEGRRATQDYLKSRREFFMDDKKRRDNHLYQAYENATQKMADYRSIAEARGEMLSKISHEVLSGGSLVSSRLIDLAQGIKNSQPESDGLGCNSNAPVVVIKPKEYGLDIPPIDF